MRPRIPSFYLGVDWMHILFVSEGGTGAFPTFNPWLNRCLQTNALLDPKDEMRVSRGQFSRA
jgi:hypothetical protein